MWPDFGNQPKYHIIAMFQLNESLKLNHTLATWLLTTHACYLQSTVFKLGAQSDSELGIFYKGMPCHLKANYMLQAFHCNNSLQPHPIVFC